MNANMFDCCTTPDTSAIKTERPRTIKSIVEEQEKQIAELCACAMQIVDFLSNNLNTNGEQEPQVSCLIEQVEKNGRKLGKCIDYLREAMIALGVGV